MWLSPKSDHMLSRDRSYKFIYLSIAILLAAKALFTATKSIVLSRWSNFSDYLYTYSGGFIRRGLIGELLIFLRDTFNIPPLVAAHVISVIGYIVVAWFVISRFKKQGYGLYVLIMGFTLGGILIFGIDAMRRDYIELSLFIAIVWTYKKLSTPQWVILSNLVAVLAIMMHEASFFFIVPICILLTNLKIHNIFKSTVLWLPAFAIFGLCCMKKGDSEMFSQIIATAHSLAPEEVDREAPGLLSFIKKDMIEVFKFHLNTNFTEPVSHIGIPVGVITVFYFLYIPWITIAMLRAFSTSKIGNQRLSSLLSLIGFQFVCLTPMFTVLSCDIVRVSLYWIMSAMIVWLVLDDREIESMFPVGYIHRVQWLTDKTLALRITRNKVILTFCALCIGVTFYQRQPRPIITSSPASVVAYVAYRVAKNAVPLIIHKF